MIEITEVEKKKLEQVFNLLGNFYDQLKEIECTLDDSIADFNILAVKDSLYDAEVSISSAKDTLSDARYTVREYLFFKGDSSK